MNDFCHRIRYFAFYYGKNGVETYNLSPYSAVTAFPVITLEKFAEIDTTGKRNDAYFEA